MKKHKSYCKNIQRLKKNDILTEKKTISEQDTHTKKKKTKHRTLNIFLNDLNSKKNLDLNIKFSNQEPSTFIML